jgi:hypothetical protein
MYKFIPGNKYFIRTVTMILAGECVSDHADMVVLNKASWIADTGRYENAVKTGHFSEVEPYPASTEVFIGKGSIVDGFSMLFDLPASQK